MEHTLTVRTHKNQNESIIIKISKLEIQMMVFR